MSDSQYIPDSDDDNSLPLLSASSVDLRLLRDFYSFLSQGSKNRLRAEANNTPFSQLYEQFDKNIEDNQRPDSTEDARPYDGKKRADISQYPHNTPNENLKWPPDTNSGVNSTSSSRTDPSTQIIDTAPFLSHPEPQVDITKHLSDDGNLGKYGTRSLRKRNFSSRHPYIADQADWLGICTVDGINEMFSADEDIKKVLKALNNLYTKRKKRYPDEDRYKAKNFYAHLGKNNLLALQGDPDAQPSSNSSGQLNMEDDDYEAAGQNQPDDADMDDDEELIPFEELQASHIRPRIINDDSSAESQADTERERKSDLESSEEESEEEYIKIGGRYRKLKTILRGVLPESAKRLGLFQEQKKPAKKRQIDRGVEPRKGLAIRKQGSGLKEASYSPKFLEAFVNDEELSEEYTPNYLNATDSTNSENAIPMPIDTEAESESEKIDTLYSKRESSSVALNDIGSNYYIISSGSDSDSVQEDDRIDHMLASRGQPNRRGPKERRKNTSSTPGPRPKSSLRNTNVVKKVQLGGISRGKSLSKGKLKKKKNPSLSQSTLAINTHITDRRKDNSAGTSKPAFPHSVVGARIANSKTGKVAGKAKGEHTEAEAQLARINPPYRRDPVKSTTAFEVESESKFVKAHKSRSIALGQTFALSHLTNTLYPPNSLTPFSTMHDLRRIQTIGDGHIFFMNENEVETHLSGRTYSFGLYKLNSSTREIENLLSQLRRLLSNSNSISNPNTRNEIRCSLMQLTKWFLIVRESVSVSIWRQIRLIFDDLTKLHTREIRSYQSVFHAQLLFIYFIMIKLGPKDEEQENFKRFDTYSLEYWSIYFSTFSPNDFHENSQNSPFLVDSINLLHFLYEDRECTWWYPIIGALDEGGNLNEDSSSLLNMSYILASFFPQDPSSWGSFLAIFNKFKNENLSEDHHHFLDICELANRKLNWPLEERLVTHLYSSLGYRKFGNFADETAVPPALQIVNSRHDIPNSTIFERFLCLVYDYVSQLSSEKIVKRFISKLVASSQYHYKKGRRYQVMFVNRVNLIILLFQISDTDLKNQMANVIESVRTSKDMFVYGRAVDALEIFCDIGQRRGKSVPWSSFQSLLEAFCSTYDSLFGMPNLFIRLANLLGSVLPSLQNVTEILEAFKLFMLVNLELFPNPVLEVMLRHFAIFCFQVEQKWKHKFTDHDIEFFLEFQRNFLNFLSNTMKKLPATNIHHQIQTDRIIELAIQIWVTTCKLTNSYNWNIIMLQKYSYLGNSFSRQRFLMFLCTQFIDNEFIMAKYELSEIDIIVLKQLCLPNLSPYIPRLLSSLSKQSDSIFNRKGIRFGDFHTVTQVATYRSQIISLIVQTICSSSFNEREGKEYLLALVGQLQENYSMHFGDPNVVDFCKRTMEVLLRFAKDKVEDLDIVWELAAKLGFPRRKKNDSWTRANEQEKLQKANYEFIDALNYNRNFHTVLDDLLTVDDMEILYSLIQIYIEAVKINGTYWPHLAYLLKYALAKLEAFEILVQDAKFKIFLDLICDVSIISSRRKNTAYILYELQALTTSAQILQRSLYIYHGYKERLDVYETVLKFLRKLDQSDSAHETRQLFTATTFGMLRSVSHRNFNPNFDHSDSEYEKALADQDGIFARLRSLINEPNDKSETGILMDFEFIL